jgi:hypothetical protein
MDHLSFFILLLPQCQNTSHGQIGTVSNINVWILYTFPIIMFVVMKL